MSKQQQIKELEERLKDLQDAVSHAYQEELRANTNRINAERAVVEAQLKLDSLKENNEEN